MTQEGFAVRPRSTTAVAAAAEHFLRICAPEHLRSGLPLDLASLVEQKLERRRIVVYPVSPDELPDAEAETRAGDDEWIQILMRDEFWGSLFSRDRNTLRARSTLAHELGHAVMHAQELRSGRLRPQAFALRRAPRDELKPFQDAEWQAHSFAGALLLPRSVLRLRDLSDIGELARQFEVSEAFVRSHLKRISRVL